MWLALQIPRESFEYLTHEMPEPNLMQFFQGCALESMSECVPEVEDAGEKIGSKVVSWKGWFVVYKPLSN